MITSDIPENHRTILAGLAFGLLASPALAAQCGGTVSFPAGATGTVVKGSVSGLETCDYTLSARKGQTLRASLGDSRLDLIAVEPVEHDFVSGDALVLDRTGPVTLRVLQTRAAARQSQAARPFKLSVSIDGPLPKSKGAAQSAGTAAAPAVKTAGKPAAKAAGNQCEGSGALTGGTANMSGALAGDAVCRYTLSGKAGQSVSLLLDAPAGVEVWLRAPGADTAMPLDPSSAVTLEASGDYAVTIGRTRNDARKGGTRNFSAVLNVE